MALFALALFGFGGCSDEITESPTPSPVPASSFSKVEISSDGSDPEQVVAVESNDGQPYEILFEAHGSPVVFLFLRTDCPIGNRYAPTIKEIAEAFTDDGVQFNLIYPDPSESWQQIQKHGENFGLQITAYRDPKHQLTNQLGATTTPEAVVLDKAGRMLYRGRIDNRAVDFGRERPRPTKHDLHDVLAAIVSGDPLAFSSEPAIGCFIEPL